MNKDKIRGMFIGTAIGDALGMPVESFTKERIKEVYGGKVETYLTPENHKWFNGEEAGTTTDDTQLTIAVAEAIINSPKKLDTESWMDVQAEEHVKSFRQYGVKGWGTTTKEAVRRLANGVSWDISGKLDLLQYGTGNGVVMKIAPVAAARVAIKNPTAKFHNAHVKFVGALSLMTHRTYQATAATFAHLAALEYCLNCESYNFKPKEIADAAFHDSHLVDNLKLDLFKSPDNISVRLLTLESSFSDDEIIANYGGGTCYCYNSLPFTYAFFMRDPFSIQSMYDCIAAGGDTDSNASMLGAMLGALNGYSIFPFHLIDGLKQKDEILDLADRFWDCLQGLQS